MEFKDYAATEASALITKLLTRRSDTALHQLRVVREAIDAAGRALESPPDGDKEVQEFVGRLVNAAGAVVKRDREEARRMVEAAKTELAAQTEEKRKLAVTLGEMHKQAESLSGALQNERSRSEAANRDLTAAREVHKQLEAARGKAEAACKHESQARAAVEDELRATRELLKAETDGAAALKNQLASVRQALDATNAKAEETAKREAAARAAAEREIEELRRTLDAALADAGRLGKQLEASAAEKGKVMADMSARLGELQTAHEQREAIAAQLKAASARLQALERAQAGHEPLVKQLESKLKDAQKAEAAFREQSASREKAEAALREEAASRQKESAAAQAQIASLGAEADRARAVVESCARAIDELAGATTIAGLLAALAKQLATQFPRVVLFRVKGNRLEGEQQVGFDQKKDVTKLVIPLNMDSMITRVVSSGGVESLSGTALSEGGAPLGGTPSIAVAMPVVIQGETIAVVYADDSGQKAAARDKGAHDASVGFAKLMLKQTGVLLMRLTHELKTLTELRNYAAMLLQEAEQMHAGDSDAGRSAEERRSRLKDTLECARQLYSQRAALEGDAAASLLDEQIGAVVDGPSTPFAQDLAAVVGHTPGKGARRAATAS